MANLGARSIRARDALYYLQESHARRRVLILDCCQSGAIGGLFRGNDLQSSLASLADSFGSYILTASTAIQLAEEREKDGHGVFTNALIDCLREGRKERITVDDWYEYAYRRLKVVGSQTPLKWGLQEEGPSFEIANFKAKHERLRREEEDQLISTAGNKLNALVASGALTESRFKSAMRLLESDEPTLFPYEQERREKLKRYLKGEVDLFDAFGNLPIAQVPPEFPVADRPAVAEDSGERTRGSGEPRKPKFLSRSLTLTVSAGLAFTVLVIVLGAVFREQAGRLLYQPSTTISPSGGMLPTTRDKTPGVPAANPDKTPASPEVIEVLRDRGGPNKPEVLAAAEAEAKAKRDQAAAEKAAKAERVKAAAEAAEAEATAKHERAMAEAEAEAVAIVPEDIQKALYRRGHALLIGVSHYTGDWDQLPSVKNDLQDLKEGLDSYFQDVEILQSPTVAQLERKLKAFLLEKYNKPTEQLFVYYSGHGFTDFNDASRLNDGYITGSDTPVHKPGQMVANALSFADIDSWNRHTLARHVLMVFDSCFSGSLLSKGRTEPPPTDFASIRKMLNRSSRYYITACRQNEEVAADSIFAKLDASI